MEVSSVWEKVIAVISFLIMITVNVLANVLRFNGRTTGEISDIYPTLITPSNHTFVIWTLIYILLFGYSVYQTGVFGSKESLPPRLEKQIRIYHIICCLSNAVWVIAWHYGYIALSLMVNILLLICLGMINRSLSLEELTLTGKLFMRIPFGIYYGWVTVIIASNLAVLFISLRWSDYGISAPVWAVIINILLLGAAAYMTWKNKSLSYAFAIIWGYTGLLVRHISGSGFHCKYTGIIVTVIIGMAVLLTINTVLIFRKKKYKF